MTSTTRGSLRCVGCSVLLLGALLSGCGDSSADEDAGIDPDASEMDGGREDGSAPPIDAWVPPEPCDAPGATEEVACGNCGTATRFCTAERVWSRGPCSDEGECAPGTTRTAACGQCGEQVETCSDACTWDAPGECTGEGVCTPGSRSRSNAGCGPRQTREVVCSDSCQLEPAGACEDDGCDTPGSTSSAPCGNCGSYDRFCTASNVWSYGVCQGEGVCTPGTTQRIPCGRCGTRPARCIASCTLEPTGACEGEGVCDPGTTSRTSEGCAEGESRAVTCTDACTLTMGACEVDQCEPGSTTVASCGNCGTRTRTCTSERRWVDGPCTGEGECAPGTTGTRACGNCGTQGTRCNVSCRWEPTAACGGEGVCAPGTVNACTTACGSIGSQTCSASCGAGTCVAPSEACNGSDEDCDGRVDEGCVSCGACAGSVAVSGSGGRYDVPLAAGTRTGSCGGAGSEGLLHLTLTETSDVFVSTHGAAGVDTVLYVRSCSCTGSERACNDDADGRTTSVLRLTSLPAGEYTIVVDTETAMSGTLPVDVYVSAPGVTGDRCGNPRLIASGQASIAGATCTLSGDYDVAAASGCSAPAGGDAEDAVYYFYVPTTRVVTFDACSSANTYDGTLYLRSVCNGATLAQQVACDDDACPPSSAGTACQSGDYRPRISVTLAPGLYYLFVDGYVFETTPPSCPRCGDFDISISGL